MNVRVRYLERFPFHFYDVKDQLKNAVYKRSNECFRAGESARDAIVDPEQLARRQRYVRNTFLRSIGGLPDGGDLNAATVGTTACDGFRVDNVVFESRPGVRVTCNLYVPDGLISPAPAVLFLCGHHDDAKFQPEYQTVCQLLAEAGLIVLAMDPPGQGERLQYADPATGRSLVGIGVHEHDYMGCQCLPIGDSLARYFVHDAMRAVDYLCGRPEVDASRIGVTGNSGGGTQTAMMMMADTRIAAAAPATFIMSRESFQAAGLPQDAEQIWPGFTSSGLDHEDLLLAMAPRPVLVLAATYDFFPIEGTRETCRRAQRYWTLHGCPERLRLFEDADIHKYSLRMAQETVRFFAGHLLGKTSEEPPRVRVSPRPLPPGKLQCSRSGQIATDEPVDGGSTVLIRDEIRARSVAAAHLRGSKPTDLHSDEAVDWLRSRVFDNRETCDFNMRLYMRKGTAGELAFYSAMWWSQPGLLNHAYVLRDHRLTTDTLPVTLAVWDGGTSRLQEHWAWIREQCALPRCVVVLDVSGSGALAPSPFGEGDPLHFYERVHKLTTDLIWIGDSLAALRTYDVVRALSAIAALPLVDGRDVALYGAGRQGLYALLAAALEGKAEGFRWDDGMRAVADWVEADYYDARDVMSVIIPGMLQYFDLPELRTWMGIPQH